MELILNELSIEPLSDNKYQANDKMICFAQTMGIAKKSGFRKIRSDISSAEVNLANNYTLHDWLTDKDVSPDYKNFLYGVIIHPFINEDDEEIEDAFIEANYYFEDTEHRFPKSECLGLAAAYLYEAPSISFDTSDIWRKNQLSILIEEKGVLSNNQVHNVFSKECFSKEIIKEFIEKIGKVEIVESAFLPNDKAIHLADHHGKAELQAFCNKIKNSPYVNAMRSTNWGGNSFIRKIHKTGEIEIILLKTQRKYALLVSTTGRNFRETEAIAQILKQEYS